MTQNMRPTHLGAPDLEIVGFQLWVHGRQFPEAEDYWDANWLDVTAQCTASGARVWVQGSILMATDVASLRDGCAAMIRGEKPSASLAPLEPELKVSLEVSDGVGHVRVMVEITPDHLTQVHQFVFDVDQSYLPGIIKQCSSILEDYPIRDI